MEPEFLMKVMELNEEVVELGGDETQLREFAEDVRKEFDNYVEKITVAFRDGDVDIARKLVAEMKYYDNIIGKIRKLETTLGILD